MAVSLAIPTIFWLTGIQVPAEILIQHGFVIKNSLKSPSAIILRSFWIIGYLSQLIFRVYIKFVKKIEQSNELLKWHTVIILAVVNFITPISAILLESFYWSSILFVILQFIIIPAIILLRHENVRQYYFSSHPKLLNVVLSVEQFLDSLFVNCFPQPQEPESPAEEVVVDDMQLESNLKVIAGQAATRIAIARQAAQTAQIQQNTQHLHASNPQSPNPKAQNPQAPELYITNAQLQTPRLSTQCPPNMYNLQPKKSHSMSEVDIN